jgi:hypothetical protein
MKCVVGYFLLLLGAAAVVCGLYVGLARHKNPGPFFLLGLTMLVLGGGCLRATKSRHKPVDHAYDADKGKT